MSDLGSVFLFLTVTSAAVGVGLMMAMAGALQARGHRIDWILVRLYILDYVARYREVTVRETGRPGPCFYPFVVSMNSALVFAVFGLVFA